jgi:hypothetical protein
MGPQGPSTKEVLLKAVEEKLGKAAIDTVKPTEVDKPTSGDAPVGFAPSCMTQAPIPVNLISGPADITVGLLDECPRWAPGSVIKWAAWSDGFGGQGNAEYAAMQLAIAAQAWNNAEIGVTFEWVPLAKDATFVVCHGGARDGVLASAFFPNHNDLNYVFVYEQAFSRDWKSHMWKVFLHELGHVLGLRHEFAVDREGQGAVEFSPRNSRSVMNYRSEPPELQDSDIKSTKDFYSLKGDPPMVGMTKVVDYTPR